MYRNNNASVYTCQSNLNKNLVKIICSDGKGLIKRATTRYLLNEHLYGKDRKDALLPFNNVVSTEMFSMFKLTSADTNKMRLELHKQNPGMVNINFIQYIDTGRPSRRTRELTFADDLGTNKLKGFKKKKLKEIQALGSNINIEGTEEFKQAAYIKARLDPDVIRNNVENNKEKTGKTIYSKRFRHRSYCNPSEALKDLDKFVKALKAALGNDRHMKQLEIFIKKGERAVNIAYGLNYMKMKKSSRMSIEKQIMFVIGSLSQKLSYKFKRKKNDEEYIMRAKQLHKNFSISKITPKNTIREFEKDIEYSIRDMEKGNSRVLQIPHTCTISKNTSEETINMLKTLRSDDSYSDLIIQVKELSNRTWLFGKVMRKRNEIKANKQTFSRKDKILFMRDTLIMGWEFISSYPLVQQVIDLDNSLSNSLLTLLFDAVELGKSEEYLEKKRRVNEIRIKKSKKGEKTTKRDKNKRDLNLFESDCVRRLEEISMSSAEKLAKMNGELEKESHHRKFPSKTDEIALKIYEIRKRDNQMSAFHEETGKSKSENISNKEFDSWSQNKSRGGTKSLDNFMDSLLSNYKG